jgi:isopenicillin N synthase-like dioxygenase
MTKTTPETIPLIDMDPFLRGTIDDRKVIADEIFSAAKYTGFMYLKNFGLSQDLLTLAFDMARTLFSSEDKAAIPFDPDLNHGYSGLMMESIGHNKTRDLKESFTMRAVNHRPSGSEFWPSPFFESFARVFYKMNQKIASDVMRAFALALDLDEDYFDDKHTGLLQTIRFLHYPPLEVTQEGQMGVGEHTDSGTLTVLFQDAAGGLQVQSLDGDWIDAFPKEGTVVINTGELLARWTNNVFRATPHRVVPRPSSATKGRQSIAFFSDPDPDVLISTFPSCITADNPEKVSPVTAGEYITNNLRKNRIK